jgi:hypothetical protein
LLKPARSQTVATGGKVEEEVVEVPRLHTDGSHLVGGAVEFEGHHEFGVGSDGAREHVIARVVRHPGSSRAVSASSTPARTSQEPL